MITQPTSAELAIYAHDAIDEALKEWSVETVIVSHDTVPSGDKIEGARRLTITIIEKQDEKQ